MGKKYHIQMTMFVGNVLTKPNDVHLSDMFVSQPVLVLKRLICAWIFDQL